MNFLHQLALWVASIPTPDGGAVASLAVVAELLMRYVPSQKPLSVIHSVSEGCHVIGTGLGKVADLLDKVFGQNTSAPKA